MRTANFAAGRRFSALLVVLAVLPDPASAQSFLQNLFGFGQPPGGGDRPVYRSTGPIPVVRPRSTSPVREISRYSAQDGDDDGAREAKSFGSKYRTLCVRSCDGYYFPVSSAAPRARFMRDAAQCRATCGEEARLFYMPAGTDDAAAMIDLAGRSYIRMPTAFKYRKTLVDGCSCRPMPWSEAELARHRQYAVEAAEAEARRALAERPDGDQRATMPLADANGDQQTAKPGPAVATAAAGTAPGLAAETTTAAAPDDAAADTGKDSEAPLPPGRSRQVTTARSRTRAVGVLTRPDLAAPRRQQVTVRIPAPSPGYSGLGGFFPSSSKYTWPGDAPRR